MKGKQPLTILTLCAVALLLLTACTGKKLPAWADKAAIEADSHSLILALEDRDFDAIASRLPYEEVTTDYIAGQMGPALDLFGPFEEFLQIQMVGTTLSEEDSTECVVVYLQVGYEQQKVLYTITYLEDGSIIQFLI